MLEQITDRRYKDYTPEDIVKRKIAIERKLKKEDQAFLFPTCIAV